MNRITQKYQLVRKIGHGGMAVVWEAHDKVTGEKVAIKKIINTAKTETEKGRDIVRFSNEFKTSIKVNSPYVMRVIDADILSNEKMIVCEYIQGEELKNYIKKLSRLNVDEVIDIAKQLALGFQAIHNAGVVHRDIKSSNIMITSHGKIKIIDFGIATSTETESVTRTNSIIGSVYYIAPELIDKQMPSPQSDIYSLGILMYEMIVGEPPFKGSVAQETAMMHKNKEVPWLNKVKFGIPQSFANVVKKATAKNPDQRYSSMFELYKDLQTVLDSKRIDEPPINLNESKPISFKSIINSKYMLVLMGIVVLLSIVSIAVLVTLLAV